MQSKKWSTTSKPAAAKAESIAGLARPEMIDAINKECEDLDCTDCAIAWLPLLVRLMLQFFQKTLYSQ